jgi:hypothetical protein
MYITRHSCQWTNNGYMETTYTIIGSDGQQYGPITLEQLKTWISERRITPDTNVLRSDTNSWLPAAQYPELGLTPQAAAPAAIPVAAGIPRAPGVMAPRAPVNSSSHVRQLKSGSSWFFIIGALTLVNSIIAMTGNMTRFVVGLGVTQIIDVFGSHSSSGAGTAIVLGIDLFAVAIFFGIGVFARKGQTWAFIVGMVIYGLDLAALVVLGVMIGFYDWLSIGFHAFALYGIFLGLRASIGLKEVQSGVTMQGR